VFLACVAGGIVGFRAHKQKRRSRDSERRSREWLGEEPPQATRGCAARLSRLRRSLSRLRRLLVRAKPNNTASYAG